MALAIYSEPYSVTGSIGQNFRRLLGAPSLDLLQTVIRESVQNISDAAKRGAGPKITIRLRKLSATQMSFLKDDVLGSLPADGASTKQLRAFLRNREPYVLEICDFETTGLGGPVRSDRIPVGTEHTDFIDFLRNIGTARDTSHGGGTYGFGKVALYKASTCSTILVDTLTDDMTGSQRRFMGCHIGNSFEVPEDGLLKRYTGRHWWGVDPGDGIVDPAMNNQASAIAKNLGFPDRRNGVTGTSIMILGFDLDNEDPMTIGARIVETLLWNFWPRMMGDVHDAKRFDCYVAVDGQPVEIPAPEEVPPLDLFCKAMRSIRTGSGNDLRKIDQKRPIKNLGTLAIETGLRAPRRRLLPEHLTSIPEQLHHIALMRPVELVVKYLEGSAFPDERLEWAGVFIASDEDEVEQAFADSEPPAHDDWVPDNISDKRAKSFVRVALRRLKEHALSMSDVNSGPISTSTASTGLAAVSSTLGSILDNVNGEGAGPSRRLSSGMSRRISDKPKISRPEFKRLLVEEGEIVSIFKTTILVSQNQTSYLLEAVPKVSVDGGTLGAETDPEGPVIKYIRLPDALKVDSSTFVELTESGDYEIAVSMPEDCAVTLELRLTEEI